MGFKSSLTRKLDYYSWLLYPCTCVLSHFSFVQLFATSWTAAHQAPLSMGFSRQEYWNGFHALLQGIFPTQGSTHVSCVSCIAGGFFLPLIRVSPEKAMAPHSSTLAWKIPWMEEPGRLQSMGSLRVGHDRVTSLSLFTFMHWRRKWQPTPMFLPGESQGRGSLVGCHLWGRTESDMTEAT